jgi:hypothetical protein
VGNVAGEKNIGAQISLPTLKKYGQSAKNCNELRLILVGTLCRYLLSSELTSHIPTFPHSHIPTLLVTIPYSVLHLPLLKSKENKKPPIFFFASWKHLGSILEAPWKHLGSTLEAPWKHLGVKDWEHNRQDNGFFASS